MNGAFVGVTKEKFNNWLMFELKACGYKISMHKRLQRMNRGRKGNTSPRHQTATA
jgi:putative component of toxin-antitoxin plasmid stabilization module